MRIYGFWAEITRTFGGTNRVWVSSETEYQRLTHDGNTVAIKKL